MSYEITLKVREQETGEVLCRIQAYSLESLEEQLHKVSHAISHHERIAEDIKASVAQEVE